MIKKFLFLKDSAFSTPYPNPRTTSKCLLPLDLCLKATDRWNQSDLDYFNPYFDRSHSNGEIVLVGKDIYYKNVVLFIQCLQNLVTFKGIALIKANIATSFSGFALD